MRRFIVAAAAVLLAATGAYAQETTGTIAGHIVDAQKLDVPGVTVTVTGPQGQKTVVTDRSGNFSIPFLTPGTYRVHATLTGFAAVDRSNLEVQSGQVSTLSFVMQVGAVSEAVQVTGSTTPIDTTSTSIGANLNSTTLEQLPVGRRFSDTIYLAPGVSSAGTVGHANPSVSGSSGLENKYVVDGVNLTNGGYGALGSYSIIFGSLGNGTPYDFMQDVQVKTGGYEAEYGQATGGVINVVTKSGTNTLRGSVFGYTRPESTESAWRQVQTINGTVNTTGTSHTDAGVTVGGPVVAGKVFFFGAVDPSMETRTLVAPKGFPLESLGPVDQNRRIFNYAAKGTWQASPTERFDASFFGDPAHGDNGPQRTDSLLRSDTSGFSALDQYGGHTQTVRYQGVPSSHFLLEATVGHALNRIQEVPSVNTWNVLDTTVEPNVRSGGIGFYEAGNRSDSWQYNAKATSLFDAAGDHQLSYGMDFEDLGYDQINQRTGPTFTTPAGDQTATGAEINILADPTFGKIYHVTRANLNALRSTSQRYFAAYVEDTWRIGNSVTIKPGLRYEQETLAGTIIKNFSLTNNWSPRIGVAWDPTGTGRASVFAHYGRYYARVPNDLAARSLSADASITADYFDPNLTMPVPNGVLAANTLTHYTVLGAGADTIDPNAKLSYYNEYLAGGDYQMGHGLTLGARFIHRDIGRVLEDIQQNPVVAFSLGEASTVDYTLTNPGPSTPVLGNFGASFEKPVHNYNAIEFTANKQLSQRWALIASYQYSRLRGTYEGFYREDNGQSDPGITSLYDFPTNDPSYTAIGGTRFGYQGDIRYLGVAGEGPLPLDRPHQTKIYGTYEMPHGLMAALGVDLSSGTPLTGLAANPVYDSGGEIPLTPRGQGFMTSDGFKTRTPFTTTVNGQLTWRVPVMASKLALSLDAFNLFNANTVLDYNNFYETTFGALNPDYGVAGSSGVLFGQQVLAPRQIRFGARLEF